MSFEELLERLHDSDIRLSARLVVDAPAGAITPEIRDALREFKARILQSVVRDMAWAELQSQRWGAARGDGDLAGKPTS